MTLPEMVFGETDLVVANAAAGVELSFKAYDSLAACGDSSDIKVSMSKKWMEANSEVPDAQQYDWTYSTLFKGTVTKSGEPLVPQLTSSRKIDLESLKVRSWRSPLSLFCSFRHLDPRPSGVRALPHQQFPHCGRPLVVARPDFLRLGAVCSRAPGGRSCGLPT